MDEHGDTFGDARAGRSDVERAIPVAVESGPILVITDGRRGADAALVTAAFLAGRTGAEVRVVSVVEPEAAWDAGDDPASVATMDYQGDRRHLVDAQVRRTVGEDAGWPVTISTGPFDRAIRFATGTDACLIVPGRGWHPVAGGTAGSATALRMLAATGVPVYLAASDMTGIPTRAVVGIDFGAASLRAASVVSEIVAAGGTIYLVHVTPLVGPRTAAGVPVSAEPAAEDTRAALDRIGRSLRHAGAIRVQSVILYGQPSTELLAFADGVSADLVACGASAVADLRVGEIASTILRAAACSILVAPSPSSSPSRLLEQVSP